ncbi:MAG: hypothetical protein AB7L92_03085 [Alphaproteobacteria bacterium]
MRHQKILMGALILAPIAAAWAAAPASDYQADYEHCLTYAEEQATGDTTTLLKECLKDRGHDLDASVTESVEDESGTPAGSDTDEQNNEEDGGL